MGIDGEGVLLRGEERGKLREIPKKARTTEGREKVKKEVHLERGT